MTVDSSPRPRPGPVHRPRVTSLTVKEVITGVQRGAIRLPTHQRPLRWKAPDVQKLFDSIWRGVPVGSLIFLEHPAPAGEEIVGGATILVPPELSAWWVVDGQQRVTSLAAALLDLDHRGDRRWQLFFDPDEPGFVTWSWSASEHAVPVSVLGDLPRLLRWTREHEPSPEQLACIEDARQQLLGYALPAYVVDEDDLDLARLAYARLNDAGLPLPATDTIVAKPLLGDGELDLDALQAICNRNDFGMPSRAEVRDAVMLMSGRLGPERAGRWGFDQRAAADALARAITFLQERCGIPHVRLIPLPGLVPILARWFHIHLDSEPATLDRLAQWVWREAMIVAERRGAEEPRNHEHALAIRPGDEQGSLDRLMLRVGARPPLASWSLERFDPRSTRSRIEMLAMLSAGPRDLVGPVRLAALLSDDQIAREIVSPRVLGALDPRLPRSAANRALLDASPGGLEHELRGWDPERDAAVSRSHLIVPEALAALVARDFEGFLRLRAAVVEEHVLGYLEARARWDGPVVRPHRYYSDELPEPALDDEATK